VHLLSVFSLRNRALIALIAICAALFGGISLSSLKQELIPSLSLPQLFIVTSYPGASPDVVSDDVTDPIESAIQSVEGLSDTTATSQANASTVTAAFDYGTDIATAEQKVTSALNRISSQLPEDADPQVLTFSLSDLPVVQLAVTSDLEATELANSIDTNVLQDIEDLDGVSDASLLGASTQRVTITPRDKALDRLGLTPQDIRASLEQNGVLLPSGEITENGETLSVQSGTKLESAGDIADLPVLGATESVAIPSAIPGQPGTEQSVPDLRLHTIGGLAEVEIVNDPITGISRVNGEDSVTIAVSKQPAGNTVEVSQQVLAAIDDLEDAVGGNTEFTVVFDQAPYIQQSIESLATEGLLGLVFAVIVILIFLLSVRSTLVTAISIPISVLITFIGMLGFGYTLNIITLGALTIAIGRVVDDSIVVIENIKRHLTLGESKIDAIRTAVREVAGAVTASTITTVAVFLPLALVSDVTGELFRPFAMTVTIALVASLFVSLTIVPVLAYWFLGRSKAASTLATTDAAADELEHPTRLQRAYLPVIQWTLKFPAITLIAAIVVLGGTVALVPSMKTNFLGDSGQNTLSVSQSLAPGTSLRAQDRAATEVEEALTDIEGIETVQLSLGSGGNSLQSAFSGGGDASFSITTDPDADQEAIQADVREAVDSLDDAGDITVTAGGAAGFGGSDIEVAIEAGSEADLNEASDSVLAAMRDLDVTAQATSNLAATQPFIQVAVDRAKAAKLGVSDYQVGQLVTQAMNPNADGSIVIDETTMSIYIQDDDAPTTIAELRDFRIPTADGEKRLSTLAEVEEVDGPASITTVKGVRSATVTVTPNSDDLGTASTAVSDALADVELPASADAEIGGATSDQADAFSQLGLALLAAILIVYIVMVATFKSLRQPLLLLISVPFAATGAIALQVISGIPLGVSSLIGVLMLIGIVVTNAIVLVDLINQYRERGMPAREAIVHGASRRLRPILMTALATIFALVPLAIGITGHGGFISQPLAIVVIGGLVSSTVLTLVVLPTLYWVVEGARERREARRADAAAVTE
jgi:HAE1 family hydrophobic/amphiphilic exporter-1